MTQDEWDELCRQINLAWPDAPLTDQQSKVYFVALRDLDREIASAAIVELVKSGADTVPPPRRILRVATDAMAQDPESPLNVTLGGPSAATTRLVVSPEKAAATADATAALGGTPGPGSSQTGGTGPSWLQRNWRMLAGGFALVAIGIGAGVGIAFLAMPNADKAYAQGKSEGIDIGDARGYDRGHDAGYSEGKSDGYDNGYSEGKSSVFGNLEGGPPTPGEYYLIQYDSSGGIESWWSDPISPGDCVRIVYGGGSGDKLQRGLLC